MKSVGLLHQSIVKAGVIVANEIARLDLTLLDKSTVLPDSPAAMLACMQLDLVSLSKDHRDILVILLKLKQCAPPPR